MDPVKINNLNILFKLKMRSRIKNKSKIKIGFIIGKNDDPVKGFSHLPDKYKDPENGVHVDLAVAWTIKEKYKAITVDIILPTEITVKRLLSNDVNFCLGLDIITALYIGKGFYWGFKDKKLYPLVKQLFKNKKYKVFPPWNFQNFIYEKGSYLLYLQKHGIPIAPTLLVSSKGTFSLSRVQNIINKIDKKGWDEFIIKPELSAWNLGTKKLSLKSVKKNPEILRKHFIKYKEFPVFFHVYKIW